MGHRICTLKSPNPRDGQQISPETKKEHAIVGTRTEGVPGQTTSVILATGAPSVVRKVTRVTIATKTDVIVSYLILVMIMNYVK